MANLKYMPVLRCKLAEWNALRLLSNNEWHTILPIIELVPKEINEAEKRLPRFVELVRSSANLHPFFLDTRLVDKISPATARLIYSKLVQARCNPIPIVTDSTSALAPLVPEAQFIGLRVYDFKRANIQRVMDSLSIDGPKTYLLLDFKLIDNTEYEYRKLESEMARLANWKSLTIIGGSFPRDLSMLEIGEHKLPRLEWALWNKALASAQILRPNFGDYTIQHAHFAEPPARANFSASIRYTSSTHWVVIRGQGVFVDGGPGFKQWPANAQLLIARKEYMGADYSNGDLYIYDMAQQDEKTGSAGTWLAAGINHHLTVC